MVIIRNIALLILLILIITTIHELGHLLAAKAFGVYCSEFSIGMGPKLYEKKFTETAFCIRAFPIGGFVAMAGDDNETGGTEDMDIPVQRSMKGIAKWKRAIVMLAGIFMNVVLGFIIYSLVILNNGTYIEESKPAIYEIKENMPAASSALMQGDIIKKIEFDNGAIIKPDIYSEISLFAQSYYDGNGPWHIEVLRDNKTYNIDVMPEYNDAEQRYIIGIVFSDEATSIVQTNILNCFKYGFKHTLFVIKVVCDAFISLFKGIGLDSLSGPVGMYSVVEESVQYGMNYYVQIIAMVSLNVAIFNAIPLPIFDGGRILLLLIEVIMGKPLSKKTEENIMGICMILLLMLVAYTTSNDIIKLIRG